jgi:hypothetical protein
MGIKLLGILSQPAIKSDSCSRKPVAGTIYCMVIFKKELRRADANGAAPQHRLDQVFNYI